MAIVALLTNRLLIPNSVFTILLVLTLISGCQRDNAPDATGANGQLTQPPGNDEVTSQADPWLMDCQADIAQIRSDIARLESYDGPLTVETILAPLNLIELRIYDGSNISSLIENVHPDPVVRERASQCTTAYADAGIQLSLSRAIYDAVNQVDISASPADTRRYLALTLQGFRLAGVDKDEDTRRRIRELNDRITRLGQEFDRNILEDVRYIEVPVEELDGLPEDFIAGKTVDELGNVRLSTRYVDSIPVYTYVHSDKVREQLRQLDRSRGYPQNEQVLKNLLIARHELANLLGFENFADFITSDKMIGSGDNALAFIQQIHAMAEPVATRDIEKLLAHLRQFEPDASEVQRWQATYLEEMIRRQDYNINATELRQYFSYGKVKEGIFNLVEHLFDVDIRPWDTAVWHESVEAYEMYEDNQLIGRFFLDMHPRDGKYQHAAAFSYLTGIRDRQLPVSVLVCNFAGGDDPQEPMEYSEVRTFLHEFGHLLHSLFGGHQRWARLSGIATEWDFVEAPSQMLEEWMYDEETLQSFAINDKGEPIPSELVESLQAARHFGEGAMTNVQMYYSALSLEYHRLSPESLDLTDEMLKLEATYSPYPHQKDTYFYANLGHLNGYSAIYYTYMWSNVIARDMFSRFEENGLRDKQTALAYRDKVLAPGGLKPAAQLVEDFLGRPYNFQAFSRFLAQGLDAGQQP